MVEPQNELAERRSPVPTKTRLIEMLERARSEERQFIDSLSVDERSFAGSMERWSAKDIVGFLSFIRGLLAYRLSVAASGKEPEHPNFTDELSADVYQANHAQPWEAILAESDRTFGNMIAQVKKFSNEDLANPGRFPWRKGRPLWQMVLIPAYFLPYYHVAHFYYGRGDAPRANFMQEQVVESLNQMDPDQAWHARSFYNLACFYATTGQKDRAIARLQEALQLAPHLTPWAKEDRDLVSLHHEPAFQTLVKE
jgi:tetratricopeptide (TPR) repeat protein